MGVHPSCKLDLPPCSCHIPLMKPLYSPEEVLCGLCCVVLLVFRVASLLAKCFLIHLLYTLLCFSSMVVIQCVVCSRWRARHWYSDKNIFLFFFFFFFFGNLFYLHVFMCCLAAVKLCPCWLRSPVIISALQKVGLRTQWQQHQSAPHYFPKRPELSAG